MPSNVSRNDPAKDPTHSEEGLQTITKAFNDGLLNNKVARKKFALNNNFYITKVERWANERKRQLVPKRAKSKIIEENCELLSDNIELEDKKPFFGTGGSTMPFHLQRQPSISSSYCNAGIGTSGIGNWDLNSNTFHFQPAATTQTTTLQAIGNPTPLHVYLNYQASISPKAFAASVWNLANSGRLVVMPESSAYNHERERGPVTETLAPSNTESFGAFIEQYYATLSGANGSVANATTSTAAPSAPIDLTSPFEPNLFTTPFKK